MKQVVLPIVLCLVYISGHCYTFADFVPEKHRNWNLLDHRMCGMALTDRIIGGTDASLGQYPWLVQLGSEAIVNRKKVQVYFCGGALITPEYVVTASHCEPSLSSSESPKGMTINTVRAGEYNTETDPDCVDGECAPSVQHRNVSTILVHPSYDKPPRHYDIMLIKVTKPFEFNGFVNSICLLPSLGMKSTYSGESAHVAGWGISDISTKSVSKILQTVTLPIMTNDQCRPLFARYLEITAEQMCVGGKVGFDSCSGDSGGPLMKVMSMGGPPRTYILGVVSLGFTRCGATENPGIYSRMTYFEEWVLDNIG